VYLSISWMFGSIYAALIAWATLESENFTIFSHQIEPWRLYLILCSFPALVAALSLLFFPESPQFHLANGRSWKAYESLLQVCKWNNVDPPEEPEPSSPDYYGAVLSPKRSFKEMLDHIIRLFFAPYRRVTAVSCSIWVCISFAYYGYTTWQPQYLQDRGIDSDSIGLSLYLSTFIISLFQLPGSLLSALCVDRVGRRLTLSLSLLISACAMLGVLLVGSASGAFYLSCAYSLLSVGSWNILNVLSSEMFPAEVRGIGYGVSAGAGRLGSALGSALFGLLSGGWALSLCVFGLICGCVLSAYCLDAADPPA
jgi:hypothetical protein